MPPAPAVSSSSSGQRSDSPSTWRIASPTRSIDSSSGSPTVDPGWNTTPSAPIASPVRSACESEFSDFLRISPSLDATLIRYTAWITTDSIGPAPMRERNASTSSCFHCVGRHMRGDWLKIWSASQPYSIPRSWAFTSPPAVETCPPISIAPQYRPVVR